MNKLKAGLVAGIGLVVGTVALRRFRRRRETPKEEAETAMESAKSEAEQAAAHASAAVRHARTAGEKAVEHTRGEIDVDQVVQEGEKASKAGEGRLKNARKRLIRR